MANLVTLIDTKQWLQITTATYDDLLNKLIPRASQIVESFTQRIFTSTEYKQIYDGSGDFELALNFYPLISVEVLSMSLDKETKLYSDIIATTEILLQKPSGIVELYDTAFSKGRRNIYIEYTAGYAAVPEDIQTVVLDLIYKKFKDITKQRIGLSVKNVMSENVSYIYTDINPTNKKVLRAYRKRDHIFDGVDVIGWAEDK